MIRRIGHSDRQSIASRFFYPSLLVFGIWLIMKLLYMNAWKFDLGIVNTAISWVCGLGDLLFRIFTPLIVYLIAVPRGATLVERISASFMPTFGWIVYQLYVASGVFSIGETIYYGFSSAFLFCLFTVVSAIGLCELVLRLLRRLSLKEERRYLGPILAILTGPLAIFLLMIWGGGVHFFYVYQEGYKLFFR
jgi:hypothetical protein